MKNLTKNYKKLTSEMASLSRTQSYSWLINESILVAVVARAVIIYANQGRVFSL
jgi:peroxiredoxin